MIGSCLGFLGALVGMPLVGNVGESIGADPGQGKSKTGYYRRIIKVKSSPVDELEYRLFLRHCARYQRELGQYLKVRGVNFRVIRHART